MTTSTRARNLLLSRALVGSEVAQLVALEQSVPQSTLQAQAYGNRQISDAEASRYAQSFGLPPDWFDRDNEELLRMGAMEYRLVRAVLRLQAAQQVGLLSLLEPSAKG